MKKKSMEGLKEPRGRMMKSEGVKKKAPKVKVMGSSKKCMMGEKEPMARKASARGK